MLGNKSSKNFVAKAFIPHDRLLTLTIYILCTVILLVGERDLGLRILCCVYYVIMVKLSQLFMLASSL